MNYGPFNGSARDMLNFSGTIKNAWILYLTSTFINRALHGCDELQVLISNFLDAEELR